jgi:uncharacterized protein (DUF433 family)
MSATRESLLERITVDSEVRFEKPCVRGHRITIQEILEWLSTGHPRSKSWPIIPSSKRMTSLPCTLMPPN